jgi:propanediol dehydratase small subunit
VREHANVLRAYGRHLRDAGREREALGVFERAAEIAANLQVEPVTAER